MWTMSSSRGESGRSSRPAVRLGAAALLAAAVTPAAAERPLPAIARSTGIQAAARNVQPQPARIAIRSARLLAAAEASSGAARLLGAVPHGSGGLLAVDLAEPLNLTRSASPILLINGKAVEAAVSQDAPRTVVGRLPAASARADAVTVQVAWQGDLERTLSAPVRVALKR